MNRIIKLTSVVKDDEGNNIIVRAFVDSTGQYWKTLHGNQTVVRYRDGGQFPYVETPEEIDRMIGMEEPKL